MHPFTVALTGGIASGKSEIARRFAALGASVVDADVVAREIVQPGMPALEEIAATFGKQMLDASGSLERAEMRALIFGDADARRRLETILHPRVRAEMLVRTDAAQGPYALLVIPLLVETAGYDWVDRILVVDLPRELQLARAIARDRMAPSLAEAMIDAQASREQRLAAADDVIDNSGAPDALDAQVAALHEKYLDLAATRASGQTARSRFEMPCDDVSAFGCAFSSCRNRQSIRSSNRRLTAERSARNPSMKRIKPTVTDAAASTADWMWPAPCPVELVGEIPAAGNRADAEEEERNEPEERQRFVGGEDAHDRRRRAPHIAADAFHEARRAQIRIRADRHRIARGCCCGRPG